MKFQNRLKGSVTQALIKALLTDAGLSVVPLGIEEVVRDVADLDEAQYRSLQLPTQLRTLPDFFVANAERTSTWLVEVKFRRTWNDESRDELLETLREQARHWSPLYLVLLWGETPSNFQTYPSSWLKAGKLVWRDGDLYLESNDRAKLFSACDWTDFSKIQEVFPQLNSRASWDAAALSLTVQVSRGLVDLQRRL